MQNKDQRIVQKGQIPSRGGTERNMHNFTKSKKKARIRSNGPMDLNGEHHSQYQNKIRTKNNHSMHDKTRKDRTKQNWKKRGKKRLKTNTNE